MPDNLADRVDVITRTLRALIPGASADNLTVTITEHRPAGGTNTWIGTLPCLATRLHHELARVELAAAGSDEDGWDAHLADVALDVLHPRDDRNMPCGESGCYCPHPGVEHADCACGCDCPRYTNEIGEYVIVGDE